MAIGIGEALRNAREEQGRSIEEAARSTRVRSDHIHALEDEDFEAFGGDVYAKGFIQSYARYLSLDPAPLLDAYRRYVQHDDYDPRQIATRPVARPPRAGLPPWVLWAGIGLAVLIVAVGAANLLGSRTPDPATEPTGAPPSAASPSPRASATPSPTPAPTFDGVTVVILVEEECWIQASVDGQRVEPGRVFAPGDALTLEGDDRIVVTYGNAGGVRVEYNGQDLGPPGGRGGVTNYTYTRDGATEMPPASRPAPEPASEPAPAEEQPAEPPPDDPPASEPASP